MRMSWILCVLVHIMSTHDVIALFSQLDPMNYGYNGHSTMTNYIFYTDTISWNEARQVCENAGGTLAKVDTLELHKNIHRVAMDTFNEDIFSGLDYYVALVRTPESEFVWTSDCSLLSENETLGEDKGQDCIRVRKDSFTFENHDCNHDRAFLCQELTEIPCGQGLILNSSYQFYPDTNVNTCTQLCHDDVTCWSTIIYPSDMCLKVMFPGYGTQALEIAVKQCIMVSLNTTIQYDYINDDAREASHNCQPPYNDSGSQVIAELPPPPSVLPSPTSCVNQTLTVNVTVESPVTIEATITQPFTIIEHSTMCVSTTETVGSTLSEYMTVTVTQSLTFNITNNLTTDQIVQLESTAAEMAKNLTVDTRSTSNYVRKLISAKDSRASASFIGYVGLVFVVAPLALIVIFDTKKIILDFRDPQHMYKK